MDPIKGSSLSSNNKPNKNSLIESNESSLSSSVAGLLTLYIQYSGRIPPIQIQIHPYSTVSNLIQMLKSTVLCKQFGHVPLDRLNLFTNEFSSRPLSLGILLKDIPTQSNTSMDSLLSNNSFSSNLLHSHSSSHSSNSSEFQFIDYYSFSEKNLSPVSQENKDLITSSLNSKNQHSSTSSESKLSSFSTTKSTTANSKTSLKFISPGTSKLQPLFLKELFRPRRSFTRRSYSIPQSLLRQQDIEASCMSIHAFLMCITQMTNKYYQLKPSPFDLVRYPSVSKTVEHESHVEDQQKQELWDEEQKENKVSIIDDGDDDNLLEDHELEIYEDDHDNSKNKKNKHSVRQILPTYLPTQTIGPNLQDIDQTSVIPRLTIISVLETMVSFPELQSREMFSHLHLPPFRYFFSDPQWEMISDLHSFMFLHQQKSNSVFKSISQNEAEVYVNSDERYTELNDGHSNSDYIDSLASNEVEDNYLLSSIESNSLFMDTVDATKNDDTEKTNTNYEENSIMINDHALNKEESKERKYRFVVPKEFSQFEQELIQVAQELDFLTFQED